MMIELSEGAQTEFGKAYNDIEYRLRDGESLEHLRDWGSKLPGAMARIAGLLHMAFHGSIGLTVPISGETMAAARQIGDYYRAHAIAAFGIMSEDQATSDAKAILRYLLRVCPSLFKARDIIHHTNVKKTDRAIAGIKILAERGYVRVEDEEAEYKIGRPSSSTVFRVNPTIYLP